MPAVAHEAHSPPDPRVRPSSVRTLPRPAGEYLRSPGATFRKTVDAARARWYLRRADAVGSLTRASGPVVVRNGGRLLIGARVRFRSIHYPVLLSVFDEGLLEVGDRTFINYGADIAATAEVRIGSDCLIGTHAIVLDNDFHELQDRSRLPPGRPVRIGDRVWIGNRVTILPGVTIGDGAVVGAGSVVSRDVPPNSVAAGNPARVIREPGAVG